jgi:Family of unknown function (DUF6084)
VSTVLPRAGAVPALSFAVADVRAERHAVVPTLRFELEIACRSPTPVRSVTLNVQLRIALSRRAYDAQERERLREVLGEPHPTASGVRSLLWMQTSLVVGPFTGHTRVELPVPCTYDFDVAAAKYLHGLDAAGTIPLDLLFSGTVFHAVAGGALRVTRISWDCEARGDLPVAVWREAMDRAFPGSAWLRLDRETFDRLYAWKASRALPTWEAAVDALLEER